MDSFQAQQLQETIAGAIMDGIRLGLESVEEQAERRHDEDMVMQVYCEMKRASGDGFVSTEKAIEETRQLLLHCRSVRLIKQ